MLGIPSSRPMLVPCFLGHGSHAWQIRGTRPAVLRGRFYRPVPYTVLTAWLVHGRVAREISEGGRLEIPHAYQSTGSNGHARAFQSCSIHSVRADRFLLLPYIVILSSFVRNPYALLAQQKQILAGWLSPSTRVPPNCPRVAYPGRTMVLYHHVPAEQCYGKVSLQVHT